MKSVFRSLVANQGNDSNILRQEGWRDLWCLKMHERFKLLLWKVLWDIIPTKCKIAKRVGSGSSAEEELQCPLCGAGTEKFHHLLLMCPYSRVIWSESQCQINIAAFGSGSVGDWIQKILHPHQRIRIPLEEQHLFQLYTMNAIDLLWCCTKPCGS